MGSWQARMWTSAIASGLPRRERRSGEYHAYVPDNLSGSPLALDGETDELLAHVERRIRQLETDSYDLAAISRFLLRSEAIASSRIEGISPSARQVALAELGQAEEVKGIGARAQFVANNMTVVREATTRLVTTTALTAEEITDVHAALLPDEPRHHGLRGVPNWIGGSHFTPLEAEFVPPPPEMVPALMDDLASYLNGAAHSPIAQAALVHAQFETIHPYTDGNGRVGRALIHTALTRRGLTKDAVLPISLVLATLSDTYVSGLMAYRTDASTGSPEWFSARAQWIRTFAHACDLACDQAEQISTELREVREDWMRLLEQARTAGGAKRALRHDSATALVLRDLPATPVLTPATVQRIHSVSHQAASRALEELRAADILETKSIGEGRRAYIAPGVIETITWAERRLASTQFNTRVSAPHSGAPASPRPSN